MAGNRNSGRKRKPTIQKVIQGNFRKDRENPNEPHPERGIPPPRKHLSKRAKTEYRRLARDLKEMGVSTKVDGLALELCADALADYWTVMDVIDNLGHTYESTNKNGYSMTYKRPEVSIASDAWKRACTMLQQFGLTPSSRGRVSINPQNSKENKFDNLDNNGQRNKV